MPASYMPQRSAGFGASARGNTGQMGIQGGAQYNPAARTQTAAASPQQSAFGMSWGQTPTPGQLPLSSYGTPGANPYLGAMGAGITQQANQNLQQNLLPGIRR